MIFLLFFSICFLFNSGACLAKSSSIKEALSAVPTKERRNVGRLVSDMSKRIKEFQLKWHHKYLGKSYPKCDVVMSEITLMTTNKAQALLIAIQTDRPAPDGIKGCTQTSYRDAHKAFCSKHCSALACTKDCARLCNTSEMMKMDLVRKCVIEQINSKG